MPKYFATDFKYADNTSALSLTSAVKLADEGAAVKLEPAELLVNGSDSAAPVDVFENGKKIEVKAVLLFETLDDLNRALDGEQVTELFNDYTRV